MSPRFPPCISFLLNVVQRIQGETLYLHLPVYYKSGIVQWKRHIGHIWERKCGAFRAVVSSYNFMQPGYKLDLLIGEAGLSHP